jgi:hypothetical protein
MFTTTGTVTLVLLLSTVTLTALRAAPVKVTVQNDAPGAAMVWLLQFKPLRETVCCKLGAKEPGEREMEPDAPPAVMGSPLPEDAITFVS